LTTVLSTAVDVNVGDVALNDTSTTLLNFDKVKNPYKKQAAVVPALCTTVETIVIHLPESCTHLCTFFSLSCTPCHLSTESSQAAVGDEGKKNEQPAA
jgi:hypothetical protein